MRHLAITIFNAGKLKSKYLFKKLFILEKSRIFIQNKYSFVLKSKIFIQKIRIFIFFKSGRIVQGYLGEPSQIC